MLTAWGYEVDSGGVPPLLGSTAFDEMTGGRYSGDLRAAAALSAASQAVRNACGWHVSPSLACACTVQRIEPGQRVISLPANAVTAISSVTESGTALDAGGYEWSRDGLIRRACFKRWPTAWGAVRVEYTAGLDADAAPDLMQAVASIAEGVLTVPRGVTNETADGVSVSYASAAASIAAALTEQLMAQLAPYRLVRSHAA